MLELVPITMRDANLHIERHHRHHRPVRGCLFCVAVHDGEGVIRGVAITGRPVSRMLQDGYTAEVIRCCTDGTRNAPSKLYAASWRAARALGYRRLVTYTLPDEGPTPGASLLAAGFKLIGEAGGGSWHRDGRPRMDHAPTQEKLRWELTANG